MSPTMAIKVDYRTPGRANTKYPWIEWAGGETWLLVRGVDYTVSTSAMRSAACMYARRKGLNVTATIVNARLRRELDVPLSPDQEGVYVRFEKPKRRKILPRTKTRASGAVTPKTP